MVSKILVFLRFLEVLEGLERSGRLKGRTSIYFHQKRSGGFRAMTQKPSKNERLVRCTGVSPPVGLPPSQAGRSPKSAPNMPWPQGIAQICSQPCSGFLFCSVPPPPPFRQFFFHKRFIAFFSHACFAHQVLFLFLFLVRLRPKASEFRFLNEPL